MHPEHAQLARVRTSDGPRVVIVDGPQDSFAASEVAAALVGGRDFADLPELLDAAGGDLGGITAGATVPITDRNQILSVVGAPRKVVCAGLNYRTHVLEGGREPPPHPDLFPKWASTLTAPYAPVELALTTSRVDWEAEMAFVFSRRCRDVPASDAASVVLGFTAANDVSVRDFQMHASQWMPGKAWDASTPLGPAIVPLERVGVRPDLRLTGRVNDELVQDALTSDLLFGIPELVEYITSFMTVDAGDVVLTGTPGGVGAAMKPPRFLNEGDVFEVSLQEIGSLQNRFTERPAEPSTGSS